MRKRGNVKGVARLCGVLAACWIAVACLGCASKGAQQFGGESHWLAACAHDSECGGDDLSCVCGICTGACSTDATCAGGKDAACYNARSPLLLQRCEDRGSDTSHGLCLPRCTKDADCGSGRGCMVGACLPLLQSDAGATGLTSTGQPSAHASDFNNVSDNVLWDSPIEVPVPQVQIAGGDKRIVGTWKETNCDPVTVFGCARLVIASTSAGEVTGNLMFGPVTRKDVMTYGPFPKAKDPDVGYPVGLGRSDYHQLSGYPALDVPYRVLDGRLENGQLIFAWSPVDLWHTWCGLQSPYPATLNGRPFDLCAPTSAEDQIGIDDGKLALCLPPGPWCPEQTGKFAASCTGVCRCDELHCDADLYSGERQEASLTLDGTRLSGLLYGGLYFNSVTLPLTLERVSP